jgi:hypothetical protein
MYKINKQGRFKIVDGVVGCSQKKTGHLSTRRSNRANGFKGIVVM